MKRNHHVDIISKINNASLLAVYAITNIVIEEFIENYTFAGKVILIGAFSLIHYLSCVFIKENNKD